jgi:hypothetical protein
MQKSRRESEEALVKFAATVISTVIRNAKVHSRTRQTSDNKSLYHQGQCSHHKGWRRWIRQRKSHASGDSHAEQAAHYIHPIILRSCGKRRIAYMRHGVAYRCGAVWRGGGQSPESKQQSDWTCLLLGILVLDGEDRLPLLLYTRSTTLPGSLEEGMDTMDMKERERDSIPCSWCGGPPSGR